DPGGARYREPWTPGGGYLKHALAVSEIYVELMTDKSEWKLLDFAAEPACWRYFNGLGGQRLVLKPDALILGSSADYEDRYFVEVDRATEPLTRILQKARLYVSYWQSGREQAAEGIFPQVLWITPTERRAQQITDALGTLDADAWQLFAVTTTELASRFITNAGNAQEGGEQP